MTLDPRMIVEYGPLILEGFALTVLIAVFSFVFALAIAILVAVAAVSGNRIARAFATVYVEAARNLPLLLIVWFLYYVFPFWGIRLSAWVVGVVSISLYAGAYFSEVIRGAIRSVPKGQLESARAMGMSQGQAMRRIIFPQMLGYAIPPGTSQTISLVKETSILSTITVPEMTYNAQVVTGITFSPFEVYLMIALLYWGFTSLVDVLGLYLERIAQPHVRRRKTTMPDPAMSAVPAPVGRPA